MIVANDVGRGDVFGHDTNEVTLVWAGGRQQPLPRLPKTEVAERVLDAVAELLRRRRGSDSPGSKGAEPL